MKELWNKYIKPHYDKIKRGISVFVLITVAWGAYWKGCEDTHAKYAKQEVKEIKADIVQKAIVEKAVADVDVKYTKHKEVKKREIQVERAAVDRGDVRLLVAASCPAVHEAHVDDASAGMDDGGAPRLDPGAEQAYYTLKEGLIDQRATIKALQEMLRIKQLECGG